MMKPKSIVLGLALMLGLSFALPFANAQAPVAIASVSRSNGSMDIFGLAPNNSMQHMLWNGHLPASLENLGGGFNSPPAVVSWGPNRIDVFALGLDNQVWHRYQDNGSWSPAWQGLLLPGGLAFKSRPVVVSWGTGRIDIFGLGLDNSMLHLWCDGSCDGTGYGWDQLGGGFHSPPAVVSWGPGRIDIFALGLDNEVWHDAWDNSWGYWSGWGQLPGIVFNSPPAVVSWGPGRIDIFGVGTDNSMWHNCWENGWCGWQSLGGLFNNSPPAVTSWGPNRLDIFGLDPKNSMLHMTWANDRSIMPPGWYGWYKMGGTFNSAPNAVSWEYNNSPSTIDVVGLGTNNEMYHKHWYWYTGWSGWWEDLLPGGVFKP